MNRKNFLLLIALGVLVLCATALGVITFVGKDEPIPMPGDYSEAAVTSEEVIKAAEFAVNAQSESTQRPGDQPPAKLELLEILKAEAQVVAGTNFWLKLRVAEMGKPQRTAVAVVWWQAWRPKPYELTSWTWE